MEKDITNILKSWKYQPDTLIIRKILGDDGKEKIQIRIDMGILQMETNGRPDGKTPHNSKSLLQYYESLIKEFIEKYGDASNFKLNKKDMEELDDELIQYYHRRICFFALGDYEQARENAEHNLSLMDIISGYSDNKEYIESHEKYRPFVLMERARAASLDCINRSDYAGAMENVNHAIELINDFYQKHGFSENELQQSRELTILRKWQEQIHRDWEGGITELDVDDDDYQDNNNLFNI
ncbi:hypothetical protein GF312_09720 [Candidatus Poribacteria bacterium]|nr:hypothetical protein [Candidatus Poribacteria bacterium]